MKRIAILGSTGSIGTQTLDVVRKHPGRFEVVALVAGRNAELLAEQADAFGVARVVLADGPTGSQATTGWDAVMDVVRMPDVDVVVNAVVGARGLEPTIIALQEGKTVALANKESLVAGGALVTELVAGAPHRLMPIDSEHSALFQCLVGNRLSDVRSMTVTASGGPFRGRSRASMASVTVAEALAHPTWQMGRKITIDSATLMNKGLEVIEAHHLFGLPMDRIDVVVHPSSIIHGIVSFTDGSSLLQAATPDMRLPIQLALGWPERLDDGAEPIDWSTLGSLPFEPVDREAFPSIDLAYGSVRLGGTAPAVLNAANEVAVEGFLDGRLTFLQIPAVVEQVLGAHDPGGTLTLEAVLHADAWARRRATEIIGVMA